MMNRNVEILAWKRNVSRRIPRPLIFSGKGFTLIELLVVIAIIALLVSILLPSLTKAKELARLTVCATNERSIGTSVHMYMSDFSGSLVPAVPLGNPWGKGYPWNRLLQDKGYLSDTAVLRCPSHTHQDPDIEDTDLRSYTMNGWITGDGLWSNGQGTQTVLANIDNLPYNRPPAEMNLMFEVWRSLGGGIQTVRDNTHEDECDENICWQIWIHNNKGAASHLGNNTENFLFLDGHVAAYEHVFDSTVYPEYLYGWNFYPWINPS